MHLSSEIVPFDAAWIQEGERGRMKRRNRRRRWYTTMAWMVESSSRRRGKVSAKTNDKYLLKVNIIIRSNTMARESWMHACAPLPSSHVWGYIFCSLNRFSPFPCWLVSVVVVVGSDGWHEANDTKERKLCDGKNFDKAREKLAKYRSRDKSTETRA